jgi:perosamine synthetase
MHPAMPEEAAFIPLCAPNVSGNEAAYLQQCIETTYVSSVGPFVNRFEQMVAHAAGAPCAVATGSGTAALQMALLVSGVQRDDLVLMPSFTFIASANAIAHCGATPWLMDLEVSSWTIDPQQVCAALESRTKRDGDRLVHAPTGRRVAAIMPVYTLGNPPDLDALRTIAEEWKLPLVGDAAAAIGATYRSHPISHGADLTCFSFNGNKTITAGGGGMVVGDEETVLQRVRHLTTQARISRDYEHDEVGYNHRMTNLQAAVGCAQMERLEEFLATKQRIRRMYDAAFASVRGLSPFPVPDWGTSSHWFSGCVIDDPTLPTAKQVCAYLNERRIDARPFWMPIHLQKPYADAPCEDVSHTEALWQRIVTLPASTHLTQSDQQRVIDTFTQALKSAD